jgi:hypothetical protein
MDTRRRGWVRLTVTSDACTSEWHLVDTVHTREYTTAVAARFTVTAGDVAAGLRDASGE